jgi:GAF domain-containing protein
LEQQNARLRSLQLQNQQLEEKIQQLHNFYDTEIQVANQSKVRRDNRLTYVSH